MATIARRVVVAGHVQGVGFRESLIVTATAMGAVGWVRNCADGTVEACVQGEADVVGRAIAWCHRGPPAARVTQVAVDVVEADPRLRAFTRRASL
ncbi:MAG: acylphosphatase [Casimicrobiaceae bacterium]